MFGLRLLGSVSDKLSQEPTNALACAPSRCLRMRYSDSTCRRCATVCASQAIDLSDGLQLDRGACSGCLACTAVCPSGALEAQEPFNRLLNRLATHIQDSFVLGCSRNQGPAHHRLPCLGMLAIEHLLTLASHAACRLQLDCSGCGDCPAQAMLPLLAETLQLAVALQPPAHPIELISQPEQRDYRSEQLDRRGFFSSFRALANQGAQAVLAEEKPQPQQLAYGDKLLPSRRRLFLEQRERFSPAALSACTHALAFNDRCSGCMACVQACPSGALLKTAQTGDNLTPPQFTPDHCTGCGLCVEFCLDQAITLDPA